MNPLWRASFLKSTSSSECSSKIDFKSIVIPTFEIDVFSVIASFLSKYHNKRLKLYTCSLVDAYLRDDESVNNSPTCRIISISAVNLM